MRTRGWLSAVVVSLVAVTAGCGGGDGAGDDDAAKPLDVVRATSSKMAEAKSSKVAFGTAIKGGQRVEVGGVGAFDYVSGNGTFVMNIPEMQGVRLGQVEAVLVENVLYQKFPPQLTGAFGGKPWARIDLTAAASATSVNLAGLAQMQSSNPARLLGLNNGAEAVGEIAREVVRGTETTHYNAVISLSKAAAEAEGPSERKALEQLAATVGQDTAQLDIWIDDAGRTRQTKIVVDLSKMAVPGQATPAAGTTMEMSAQFYDFGTAVTATAPPADQVTDLTTSITGARP